MQMRLMLEDWGYEVASVVDGLDAIRSLKLELPDIVVTDMELPELNGLQLVAAIRRDYPTVPAVLVTGKGSEELAVEALRLGAAGYVPKSQLLQLLHETIQQILSALRTDQSFGALIDCLEDTSYHFCMANDPKFIAPIAQFITQVVQGMNLFDETEVVRLSMAIEHALLNAIYRGNLELSRNELPITDNGILSGHEPEIAKLKRQQAPYSQRQIHFFAQINRAEVRITVRDEGPALIHAKFPPLPAPNLWNPKRDVASS